MSTIHLPFKGTAVSSAVIGTLGKHLPNRTKRIVFLTSLAGRLKEAFLLDEVVISGINKLFKLASSDAALEFPYDLSKVIWGGKTREDICRSSFNSNITFTFSIASITRCIMEAIPSWLRYGSDKEIESDIELLLENRTATLGLAS